MTGLPPVALEWLGGDALPIAAGCPGCGAAGGHPPVLRTPWPGQPAGAALLRCSACGGGFFHPVVPAAYDGAPAGGEAALAFYLQQGAGLHGIAANLAALGRPPGTTLLEVGCGFGFGLDFARRALGWEVLGLDPGPFAAEGRRQLGLPVQSRYLDPADRALHGRFDVVLASEVLEHVPSPGAFVRAAHAALRPGGTFILTTPDMARALPDTPPGLLVPLLSVGYHLTLQSAASLTRLLQQAGFTEIEVQQAGGASLTARAHRGAAWPRPAPSPAGLYDRYLNDAAQAVPGDGDLWFGLVARAYRQAVNRSALPEADHAWAAFADGCRRRFGFDPEAGVPGPSPTTLEALAAREPLCLGPVLFHRALHRLAAGTARTVVEPAFADAAAACSRLRSALQRIGTDDGDAEDIAWLAGAEAALCAAEQALPGVPDRLAALGQPGGDGGAERAAAFRQRAFVSLVNAGRLDDAGCLADVVAPVEHRLASGGALPPGALDVLYCAATRQLQVPGGSAADALRWLVGLLAACPATHPLVQPAHAAQILALDVLGRHAEADALRPAAGLLPGTER